jgi:superfamily II DNA or RNA helicase
MASWLALFPHQLAFYKAFLAPSAAKRQVLLAPPGLGKGFVAQAIVHDAATADEKSRVLVLTPGPLAMQFAAGIAAFEPPAVVDVVNRRRLRELMASPGEDGVFRSGQITVMSIDFAKQEDVQDLLVDTRWSLVVVDEAHALQGQRRRLVRDLSADADRLLLLSVSELDPQLGTAIPQLRTVRWSRDVVDSEGHRLFIDVPRRKHVVNYERSEEEARLAGAVIQFVDGQPVSVNTEQRRFLRSLMVRALSSSPLAIQDFLIRQRVRLDESVEANEWWDDSPPASEDVGEPTLASLPSIWSDAEGAAADLDELISTLDGLHVDSKAEALRKIVREARNGKGYREVSLVVYTVFASTAAYVAEILAESGVEVQVLTGVIPVAQRSLAVEAWNASAGALVLTDGATEGLDLTEAHIAVHYDLPQTTTQMEQRWGRLDRVGQSETVDAYVLRDVAGTIESEEQLLRLHEF